MLAYVREVLRLHEDLHQVRDAPWRVADDKHQRDGDTGASDPHLPFPETNTVKLFLPQLNKGSVNCGKIVDAKCEAIQEFYL